MAEALQPTSAEHWRLCVEQAPVAIAMFDVQMRYLAASARWVRDYGLGGEPLVGRDYYEVLPVIPERWKAVHRRCLEGATEHEEADLFERADGTRQWFRWTVQPWTLGPGRIGGLMIFSEDVTARVEAERALRGETAAKQAAEEHADAEARLAAQAAAARDDSEARLRGVFESATDAILVAGESQTIVMANPAAATMFRCPLEQLVGAPLERFIPERYRQRHRSDVEAFGARDAGAQRMSARPVFGLRADGEEFPADASISYLKIDDSHQYMVILRDLSERRRLEAARRAQEHQLLGLFNVSSVGMAQADPATRRFVRVNAAFCRITGFSQAELLAMTVNQLNHPDDRATDQAVYEALRQGNGGYDIDKRYVRKDGAVIWVHASGNLVRDDQGRPELAFAVVEDITQRRAADQALRANEARLRQLLTELPEPVMVNRDGRLTFVNRAAQRLFGRSEAELIGHQPAEFIHPDDRPALAARIAALREAPAGEMVAAARRTRVVRPDGSERLAESAATRVVSGEASDMLVFVRDVTELTRAQEELTRSHDELRRLVAAQEHVREEERKRIARELHDDLQQKLAAIKMDLSALAESALDEQAARAWRGVDRLADAAIVSTRRIVNDLRPSMLDKFGLEPALQALVKGFAERTGVAGRVDASEFHDLGETLPADLATCLYRVAQEALNNVAKHAHARSVVVQLASGPGQQVRLSVTDDGCGIAPNPLHKHGSFGLLGIRERMHLLGGTLDVSCPPGGGTQLQVTIPVKNETDDAAR